MRSGAGAASTPNTRATDRTRTATSPRFVTDQVSPPPPRSPTVSISSGPTTRVPSRSGAATDSAGPRSSVGSTRTSTRDASSSTAAHGRGWRSGRADSGAAAAPPSPAGPLGGQELRAGVDVVGRVDLGQVERAVGPGDRTGEVLRARAAGPSRTPRRRTVTPGGGAARHRAGRRSGRARRGCPDPGRRRRPRASSTASSSSTSRSA